MIVCDWGVRGAVLLPELRDRARGPTSLPEIVMPVRDTGIQAGGSYGRNRRIKSGYDRRRSSESLDYAVPARIGCRGGRCAPITRQAGTKPITVSDVGLAACPVPSTMSGFFMKAGSWCSTGSTLSANRCMFSREASCGMPP